MPFDFTKQPGSIVLPTLSPPPANMEELWKWLHDTTLNMRMDKALPIVRGKVSECLNIWFERGNLDEMPASFTVEDYQSTVFLTVNDKDDRSWPLDKWVEEHWRE